MTTNAKVHRSVSRPQREQRGRDYGWRSGRGWKAFIWKWLLRLALIALVAAIVVFAVVAAWLSQFQRAAADRDLTRLDTRRFPVPQATVVVDSNGTELGRIFVENREWVNYEKLPQNFIDALVASEDQRFWDHKGVDMIGIGRVAFLNTFGSGPEAGASTLTQQLARSVFNLPEDYTDEEGNEDRYKRKMEEIFLAQRIEEYLDSDKEKILEQYANRIYFGAGCYGVAAAAHHYFDKEPEELELIECASLVGLIPSPNRLNPTEDPEENIRVRNLVLGRMRSEGFIDKEEYNKASSTPLRLKLRQIASPWGHLFSAIRTRVSDLIGWEQASQGGYLVETTVDLGLQRYAVEQLRSTLDEIEQIEGYAHPLYENAVAGTPYLEGSVIMIDTHTGGVLAMVGGRDFEKSEFNYATQARKPAGSAFMPVVYACAFTEEAGYSPISLIEDSPIDLRRVQVGGLEGIMGEWGMELPEGHEDLVFEGPLPARRCLETGKLAATVRLGERVGLSKVAQTARALGLKIDKGEADKLYNRLLIGQGDPGITGLEYARLYGSLERSGQELPRHELISRITRPDGTVVYEAPSPPPPRPAIDPIAAWQVRSCLRGTLAQGVNRELAERVPRLDLDNLIGHSGTTYGWTDAWFVGANQRVACAVWAGFDTQQGPIVRNGSGGRLLGALWGRLMHRVADLPGDASTRAPRGTRPVEICRLSGGLAGEGCYHKTTSPEGTVRFVRSSYVEDLRFDTPLPPACSVHPSEAPLERILDDGNEGVPVFDRRVYSQIRPSQPTVIGEDPYQAVQGVFRRQADQDESDGEPVEATEVIEAVPIGEGGENGAVEAVEAVEIEAVPVDEVGPLPEDMPFQDPEPFDLFDADF